jgi:hypothetical protein
MRERVPELAPDWKALESALPLFRSDHRSSPSDITPSDPAQKFDSRIASSQSADGFTHPNRSIHPCALEGTYQPIIRGVFGAQSVYDGTVSGQFKGYNVGFAVVVSGTVHTENHRRLNQGVLSFEPCVAADHPTRQGNSS